ncbi:hypothetical protein D3C85_15940 [compost metagenome]
MSSDIEDFQFDPDKTALENLFALIYRTNRIKLNPQDVEVELPRAIEPDEHGDNSIILVKGKATGRVKGEKDLYYARADIDSHYPSFQIDVSETVGIGDKDALIAYIDGKFNLVDGEFDIDIDDPFGSLASYTSIDIFAKDESLIYIGRKTIHIFWTGGIRRITEEGFFRVTEDGLVRIIEDEVV